MGMVIICERIMHRLFSLLSRAGLNFFVLLMVAMVGLAWLFPEPGSRNGPLHLVQVRQRRRNAYLFLLWPQTRASKIARWTWSLENACTYSEFPHFLYSRLLILVLRTVFYTSESDLLWLGTFYLAALPSTVSSSVVMVSIAGGNISAAIFNASMSSLLGIFVTPLWMNIFVSSVPSAPDLSGVILNLCLQVLLPVMAGLVLHSRLGFLAVRFKSQLRYFDQAIILLIVYRAFCDLFLNRMFEGYSLTELAILGSLMLMLFFLMFAFMQILSAGLDLSGKTVLQ